MSNMADWNSEPPDSMGNSRPLRVNSLTFTFCLFQENVVVNL